eukprot:TRINITY_DN17800_c0_g1_i1.p1 TRINITY_DN17800_c0_g1~~TRINITY_DN17800_c0_g1_i1.p1  ORF type:complete len:178 (+),score=26.52 TRINITY_DN17800_c0_g1_i1:59-592(+)
MSRMPDVRTLGPPDSVQNLPNRDKGRPSKLASIASSQAGLVSSSGADPHSSVVDRPRSFLPRATLPPKNVNGNLLEVKNDEDLKTAMTEAAKSKRPVVVNYGAPWCNACKQMLPTFLSLSNEYTKPLFLFVDVDKCFESTKDIQYTPTFRFYKDGEKIDEFYGAGPQRLRDRVWLQV